jgi:hypothetical protein
METNEFVATGRMDQRVIVLNLTREGQAYHWTVERLTWARAELTGKTNIYSVHGIGAAGVTFIMRRQPLNLGNALLWRGQHCFITRIAPCGRLHWTVEAALVVTSLCEDKYDNISFPAIMTEKYLAHQQLEPQAINTLHHVLVTPKDIQLTPGRLVEVDGISWPIQVAHTLDPWKNEYEIERTVDL